jgi:hypothetical protein
MFLRSLRLSIGIGSLFDLACLNNAMSQQNDGMGLGSRSISGISGIRAERDYGSIGVNGGFEEMPPNSRRSSQVSKIYK